LLSSEHQLQHQHILWELWSLTIGNRLDPFTLGKKLREVLPFDNVYVFIRDEHRHKYTRLNEDSKRPQRFDLLAELLSNRLQRNLIFEDKQLTIFPFTSPYASDNEHYSGFVVVENSVDLDNDHISLMEMISQHIALLLENLREASHFRNQVKSLSTIVQIDNEISLEENFETTLGNIMEKIKKAFDASTGGVMLYDEEKNTLVLQKPGFGATDQEINEYNVSLKEQSNATRVFRTGSPMVSNNCIGDSRILQRYVDLYKVHNLMTVPLSSQGKTIGVLHLANKRSGIWNENDLKLLQMMASYLGGIIERAYLVEKLKEKHLEIEKLYQNAERMTETLSYQKEVIDTHRSTLEWTLSIHNQLLKSLLNEGGLKEITEILASQIGKSVVIVDSFGQVPAMSLTSDEHQTIFQDFVKQNLKQFKRKTLPFVLADKKYFVTPFPIDLRHYNMDQILLLVITKNHLKTHELNAVRQALLIFSLELIRQKGIIETENRLRADFLDDLIFSKSLNLNNLHTRAAYLNHSFTDPNVFIILDIDDFVTRIEKEKLKEADILKIKNRLYAITENNIKKHFPERSYLMTTKSDNVLALLSLPNKHLPQAIDTMLGEISNDINSSLTPLTVSIGVSNLCLAIEDYKSNYSSTKKALDINKGLGKKDIIVYQGQQGLDGMFFDLYRQQSFREFALEFLDPVLEYEKSKKTPLIDTAETYLNSLNLQQTAKLLYSHVNTVRYRLNKIEKLLGIDFKYKDDRLKFTLALNILKFRSDYNTD